MMSEFFQTVMGRKFFESDVPELNQNLNEVRIEMHRANSLKADELQLKERELRLKEKELDLMQQMLDKNIQFNR
ncbi:hypothetical protein ACOSZF_11460 [Cytobacillus firmus]|uniref:hypothetical protein n=2 Tax=Cytobacillus firmus TaxID=1399 RepID=UPI001F45F9D4|nr:hypothetical protein [Cytobacillus firmus]MDD9311971.1 hypothetical protein [Cytobacillus firmus]MEC1893834.1 hypothetical protein [Cytobacillus firmus]MED1905363.1 hypothetical protein [Cytobacillus firmus]MED4450628.1 hypothetical protein [Cytobacillus firmus]MED4769855.1 hypothetical protein [Cytobacillus firmus]